MGLDLLKAPERDAAPELLVDWLELAAFFDEDGRVNPMRLVEQMDLDTEGDDPGFEDTDTYRESAFGGMGAEIRRRTSALGNSYPFRLTDDASGFEFVPDNQHAAAQNTYLFTLILSHAPTSDILPSEAVPTEVELRAARDVFQVCATAAAAGHTGGPAFSIGWPRPQKKAFLDALRGAWVHCRDGELVDAPSRSAPASLKDDGIDILAFRKELDGGLTQGFLVGQVASGHNWPDKSAVPVAKLFIMEWFKRAPASRAEPVTFIPFALSSDADEVRRVWALHEYIVSRTRLASLVAKALRLAQDAGTFVERIQELESVTSWVDRHRRHVLGMAL
jgi:hypothetical protein